jgi:transposase-like protein
VWDAGCGIRDSLAAERRAEACSLATEPLNDARELLPFYDFPAEHWQHLPTTNPIERTFATVWLRTAKTKGCGSRQACPTMVFKLCQSAEKHWRKRNGCALLKEASAGVEFIDGVRNAAWVPTPVHDL